jgi:putative DNA primase/helicase
MTATEDALTTQHGKPEDFSDHLIEGWSDDNTARAVAGHLRTKILSAPETREVFVWDGVRWARDRVAAYPALIRHELGNLSDDAAIRASELVGSSDAPKWKARAKSLASAAKQASIQKMVAEDPRITVTIEVFDDAPNILATPTGYVDLRTGEVLDPDPGLRITKMAGTAYDPDAEAPRFMQMLDEITEGDKDLARYLQTLLGYSMFGHYNEQELYIWSGEGSNGKDTLAEIVESALGDHVGRAAEDILVEKQNTRHLAEVYVMRGKRLVIHSEHDKGKPLAMGRVKQWTGTPSITANAMRQNPVTFANTWTHVLMTNYLPELTTSDHGTRRRLVVVPFPAKFYKRDDPEIPDDGNVIDATLAHRIIETELPGVLAWLVDGAARYYADGLDKPEAVRTATANYLDATADPYGMLAWLDERADVTDKSAFAPARFLYASYEAFCNLEGWTPASKGALGNWLGDQGYRSTTERVDGWIKDDGTKATSTSTVRGRRGILLRKMPSSTLTIEQLMNVEVRSK